jgi:23S rRNA (adenine2503-C2)-methyltransferase
VGAWIKDRGDPGYRAGQLLGWFYRSQVTGFEAMHTLPDDLRSAVADGFDFSSVAPAGVSRADEGATVKHLFRLHDGELVEAVLMHYPRTSMSSERTTVCLSTQAGCAVGCPFCATGLLGLRRNLSAAEIIDQVLAITRGVDNERRRVTHLVYMGMGEPLHNLDATIESVRRFTDSAALGLGVRRITVSTSGVVPGIDALAESGRGVNLAISLHAPVDEVRDQLVPLNRKWPVAQLLAAADRYVARTSRRVSYEYVMLRGVNDTDALADELGRLLRGHLAHVNLIPYNSIPGNPYEASSKARIAAFQSRLALARVSCTVRDTRGRRINAACGQLAASAGALPAQN